MTSTTCAHCGATTSNGLVLCDLCQYAATKLFEVLPIYFRNLARWTPGRAGSRPVPGSRVLYDGAVRSPDTTGDRISDRLSDALNALTGWGSRLVEARGPFTERPLTHIQAVLMDDLPDEIANDKAIVFTWLTAGLEHHLTTIATLDWSGDMLDDLTNHEARLRSLIDLVPGWYAGACQRRITMDQTCGSLLYVMPGLTWVTCPACGSTTAARDHLSVILDEARDWLARPKRLAEALVALLDSEPSVPKLYTRIRQWAHQGDLEPVWRMERDYEWSDEAQALIVTDQPTGFARYRLGDVLNLATRRTAQTVSKSQAS